MVGYNHNLTLGYWSAAINFRSTAIYVTDGPGETYCLGHSNGDDYPKTRAGLTFGWESNQAGNFGTNRNSSIDRRLAGINYDIADYASGFTVFRLDLPSAGKYWVAWALGDATFPQNAWNAQLQDTSTTLISLSSMSTAGSQWADVSGTLHTDTTGAWINGTAMLKTFATTILRVGIQGNVSYAGVIAHLYVRRFT